MVLSARACDGERGGPHFPEFEIAKGSRHRSSGLSHPEPPGDGERIRTGDGMRILIVDDEAEVAEALADAVRLQGHVPAVAHSGAEGLAAIEAEAPEGVFLDLVMPGLSGLDLLREIRQRHPELPIVVVTGRAGPLDLVEVRRLGVTDIVEKPWVLKQLGEALGSLRTGDGST
jgi:DNA-binding response OmpR family regulator